MPRFKRIFSVFLRVSISIILVIFLFQQVDRKTLLEIIKEADKPLLFLAFFVSFFAYILLLFRWEMLLKAAQIHLPLKRIIISLAGAHFFNLFLPSTIGGDVVRSIDLATHTRRHQEVIATVLLDRLSGYVGLVMLTLLAVCLGWRLVADRSVLIAVTIISALLAAILLVLFNRFLYSKINKLLHSPSSGKIREYIKDVHQEMHIFRHHTGIIAKNLALSVLIQAVSPVAFYVTALSLGLKINILYFFLFLPIIGAITLLPISIGGLGLRDASAIYFFAKVGVSKDLAFAMSLLNFFFILVYAAIGGLIYVFTVRHRRIQHHPPPHIHQTHHP